MALTTPAGSENVALERIGEELRTLTASMVTKVDLHNFTTTIQDTLRKEIAGIRSEVTAQAGRIQALEQAQEAQNSKLTATDTAVARQGEMLLAMRRHIEDLDNRGRHCNVRIRGVPESEGEEDAVLTKLFHTLLQAATPPTLRI
ncbi:Hypothetical predicted protein [Pelobates cultripes]|uniref:Uncharacterized protein n=1 Tax=Pelobates cultripes TaxID=61616 RepID=A0AAD1R1R2_PELCU|nr:Hypothetical predicted protein [Pelobates cultripes]